MEQPPIEVVFLNPNISKTVVSQDDFNDQVPDKSSSYLSGGNKAVEKQTRAMMTGLFRQANTGSILDHPHSPTRSLASEEDSMGLPVVMDNDSIQLNVSGLKRKSLKRFSVVKGKTEEQSQTPDFLLGMEVGSHTLLNTSAFTYYSYLNRMKEQVFWRWTRYFENENLLNFTTDAKRKTGLFVTEIIALLSPDGELQDLMVVKSSGNENFDEAVLHAFMASAPFPNPPPGLVTKDNFIHINKVFYLHIIPSQSDFFFSRRTRRL